MTGRLFWTLWLWMVCCVGAVQADRVTRPFNADWRFARGPQPAEVAEPNFDDSGWQAVRLPHDWAIAGPFDPNASGDTGKLPWRGQGVYRKVFTLEADQAGRQVLLGFDGVMAFPEVFLNGRLVGRWDYGYSPFEVDLTEAVRFDRPNVLVVRCDTRRWGSRWYPGAGIYRKVTLTLRGPVHVATGGLWVTTPPDPSRRDAVPRVVRLRTEAVNDTDQDVTLTLQADLFDPSGEAVGRDRRTIILPAGQTVVPDQVFFLGQPIAWTLQEPRLYRAEVRLIRDGQTLDHETAPFGLRSVRFTADEGFFLNGRRVQLQGVNLHHDHGPLGAAFYRRAMERQLEIMKEMGVNALRTSHNPPAAEVLDLCDRMGILVWDEVFDKWDHTAGRHDGQPPLEPFAERQIRNVVRRDRNHPSVVVWSIGNEIGEGGDGVTPERVAALTAFVKQSDPTRPVGMGCHVPAMATGDDFAALDLTGWNYARRYARMRQHHPDKPIVYSESASTLSTRGFYRLPLPMRKTDYAEDACQVDSYDFNAAAWSDIPDHEFRLMQTDRFVAGEFVWTGFDYLGEPTPFSRQARSSYFGVVDLVGIPKDRFYLYRSHWRPDVPTVHLLPHWNWPERVGQPVPVFVYTNGDEAELFFNGRSLGRRRKGQHPPRPVSLARTARVTASSSQDEHRPEAVLDGDRDSRWCASSASVDQWIQIDLGAVQPIRAIALDFEREEKLYAYRLLGSVDGEQWQELASKPTRSRPRWGGPTRMFHGLDARARWLRLQFQRLNGGAWASLREWGVYREPVESDYYDVTYDYRLRWNDVLYEPGELKVVAYRDGRPIGTAVRRTAGAPAALRLTPDRVSLRADGEDLAYVLVEAVDDRGTECPLADDTVTFSVRGPAEIAGIGNGNPLSLEPFGDAVHRLFHGKAMLILRTVPDRPGWIAVSAAAGTGPTAHTVLQSR